MENKTPTPRTDEAEVIARKKYESERECGWPAFDSSGFDFARALELELNEAREEAQRINGSCQLEVQLLRDANKQANAAIGDIANECKSYVSQLTTAQQEIVELRKDKELLDMLLNVHGLLGIVRSDSVNGSANWFFTREAIYSAMKGTKE